MKMPQQEQEQILLEDDDHSSVLLELDLSTESSCDQIYQQLSQAARQCQTTTTTITNTSTATCMVSVRIHDGATDTDTDPFSSEEDEEDSNKRRPRRRKRQPRHGRGRFRHKGRRSSSLDQDDDDCDDDDDDDDARPCGSDKLLQILMQHPCRTCVQELSLFNLEEESIAISLLCQLLPALPNLKTLLLDNVMLEEDDDWMSDDYTPTTCTTLPNNLNTASLTCCGPAEDTFLQWLIAASKTSLTHLSLCQMLLSKKTLEYHVPQLHGLHALTLAHIPGLYQSNLCHFMGASGRMQLRQLVLRDPIPVPLWNQKMWGGLRQLSSLQSLTLSVQVSLSSSLLEWERVWVPLGGLSQLSSLTLQVVGNDFQRQQQQQQQSNKRSQWWWSSFVTPLASFLRHDKTLQSLDIVFPKQWDFVVEGLEATTLLDSNDNNHDDDDSSPTQSATTIDSLANNEDDDDDGFFWRPLEQVLAHENTVLRNFTVTFGSGNGGASSLGSLVKPISGWLALDHEDDDDDDDDDDDSIHITNTNVPDERSRTIQISPLVEYYLALNRAGRHDWRQRGERWTVQQGLDHLVKAQQHVGPLDNHGSEKLQQQQQYCFELSMLFHFLSTHPSIMVL